MIDLPLGLRTALETNKCVLFIGAGVGKHLLDGENNPAPNGTELAKEIAIKFDIEVTDGSYDLAKIAQIVELRKKGRKELLAFLEQRFSTLEPDETFKWLFAKRWRAIFTTNYDNCIQKAYQAIPKPKQTPVSFSLSEHLKQIEPWFEVPIYHLHGSLFLETHPKIIITDDDYSHYDETRRMLFNILKVEFSSSPFLYIGYANEDRNWKDLLSGVSKEFGQQPLPLSYRVSPTTDPLDTEILRSKKSIQTLACNLEELKAAVSASIPENDIDEQSILTIKKNIPKSHRPAFDNNPTAIARLNACWEYVNEAPFQEPSNIKDFVKGDCPNWSAIGSKHYFERDVQEEFYDSILDFITSENPETNYNIVLSPAGYGTTTLLKSLATKLIEERAAHVYMLKPSAIFNQGDVELASEILPSNPTVFFVDNASDYSREIRSAISRLRELKRSAFFVLGERKNEWRQCLKRPKGGSEFEIEQLSDPEIDRLLHFLEEHDSLNQLAELSHELRVAQIKKRHGKELLVAMREATEGLNFDAIIEDEFRGIGNEFSKRLYLLVCCFYQHGAYVRDELLAELLEENIVDMYQKSSAETEGIVIYDPLDNLGEKYAARARHGTIAKIVWERCGDQSEQEPLLLASINKLNLNYKQDANAFECFIRSDTLVDSIGSLEGRINFFEKACKKEPDSPYVRQHYARMLKRADKAELALSQIDTAIELNSGRIFHHTKGVILREIAINIDSLDVARRRLMQSEACFKKALSIYSKDEYSYQGLSELYIDWCYRGDLDDDEITHYISRAESTIQEGLRTVSDKEGLWIQSSKVNEFIGNNPSQIHSLERAIQNNPDSIVARYLLGRLFRKMCNFDKAIEVLQHTVAEHPEEFRSYIEYTLCLIGKNESYSKAATMLQQSCLYGYGDSRYIAILGGLKFMEGEFSEASEIFKYTQKKLFTATEKNKIYFKPQDRSNPNRALVLKGRVSFVRPGYSIIKSDGYPEFFCHSSKYHGVLMEKDLKVSFTPSFAARGPLAINPKKLG